MTSHPEERTPSAGLRQATILRQQLPRWELRSQSHWCLRRTHTQTAVLRLSGDCLPLRRARFQFFANYPSQRVLELRGLTFEVFSKRRIDECLIPGRTPRGFRQPEESVHNVLVEPDAYADLALGLRFRRGNPAPFSFAEIVSVFHRSASYWSRSWASASRPAA